MAQTERYAEQSTPAGDRRWRLPMCYGRRGVSLIILVAVILWAVPTLGFVRTYQTRCKIFYNGEKPLVVTSTIRVKLSGKHVMMLVRTPNGKTFIIENGGPDQKEWFLDHKVAEVLKSKDPDPCFQNEKVKVCF
jgi:hypothetical protein